jgi:hypothetical protein
MTALLSPCMTFVARRQNGIYPIVTRTADLIRQLMVLLHVDSSLESTIQPKRHND